MRVRCLERNERIYSSNVYFLLGDWSKIDDVKTQRALFVGDTPVLIHSDYHSYREEFIAALARMAAKPVETIYFGHGDPLTERCNERLEQSIRHLRLAKRLGVQ